MSPVPENIRFIHRNTDSGVTEPNPFTELGDQLKDLIERPKQIITPPEHLIFVGHLPIEMDQAIVFPGKPNVSFFDDMERYHFIPSKLDDQAYLLEIVFGITIQSNEKSKQITVSRNRNSVNLQHLTGPKDPISENNRHAIMGMALLPDELWPRITTSGLIVGDITCTAPQECNWLVEAHSIQLPDPDGHLGYYSQTKPNELHGFNGETLLMLTDKGRTVEKKEIAERVTAYLNKELRPIGVFFDKRRPQTQHALQEREIIHL
jgi:hypothetical protein